MTYQVRQIWLSGAIFLASLTSANAITSFRPSVGVAYEEGVKRQLGVPVASTRGDFNTTDEERGLLEKAQALLKDHKGLTDELEDLMSRLSKDELDVLLREEISPDQFKSTVKHLLKEHDWLETRNLLNDPTSIFWRMRVNGKPLGVVYLQNYVKMYKEDEGAVMKMMFDSSNSRSSLNDEALLHNYISYTDTVVGDVGLYVQAMRLYGNHDFKKMGKFVLTVLAESKNVNLKTAASWIKSSVYDDFEKAGWTRERVAKELDIDDRGLVKTPGIVFLDDYENVARGKESARKIFGKMSFASDKSQLTVVFRYSESDPVLAEQLQKLLLEKWVSRDKKPDIDGESLTEEERIVYEPFFKLFTKVYVNRWYGVPERVRAALDIYEQLIGQKWVL